VVVTDHKPLIHMLQSVHLSEAICRWFDIIMDYNFLIIHCPGIMNVLPDALSRMYGTIYERSPTWGVTFKVVDNNGNSISVAGATVQSGGTTGDSGFDFNGGGVADTAAVEHKIDTIDLSIELEKRGKVAPPISERIPLIQSEHQAGHFGREAIYKKLYNNNHWWFNMRSDIASVIADCDPCTRYVVGKAGYNPASFITACGPWDHIQIDSSVHLPGNNGYTVLLVIIDVFTGFVILRALSTNTATNIAQVLLEIFSLFGLPKILQSDNGSEFSNEILHAYTKLSGFDHRFITPYNPRVMVKLNVLLVLLLLLLKRS
jgi:hypothetical protein